MISVGITLKWFANFCFRNDLITYLKENTK